MTQEFETSLNYKVRPCCKQSKIDQTKSGKEPHGGLAGRQLGAIALHCDRGCSLLFLSTRGLLENFLPTRVHFLGSLKQRYKKTQCNPL